MLAQHPLNLAEEIVDQGALCSSRTSAQFFAGNASG
jgi:hypothetical protein